MFDTIETKFLRFRFQSFQSFEGWKLQKIRVNKKATSIKM